MTAAPVSGAAPTPASAPHAVEVGLGVLALGALVVVPAVGTLAALVFLIAGGFLALLRFWETVAVCLRHWLVFLLPGFCLMSFLWSEYPTVSFRAGLQLLMTIGIAVTIAHRLSPREFTWALFALLGLSMGASFVSGDIRSDTSAWLGIYESKNALAGAAAVFSVTGFGLAADHGNSNFLRLIAIGGFLGGCALVVLAQSVSALAIVPPSLALIISTSFLHRLRPLERAVVLIFAGLSAILASLLVAANFEPLFQMVLETTGKDITLTGRTDLWTVALGFIAERPVLGLGYQAFWIQGNAPAEALWVMFGIDSRGGFNFHNMYLSNAVEIGLLGVAIQAYLLFGATFMLGLWAVRSRNPSAAILFAQVAMVLMVSFIEVPVFFQFSLRSVIVMCAFVYGVRALSSLPAR